VPTLERIHHDFLYHLTGVITVFSQLLDYKAPQRHPPLEVQAFLVND
jgi:hypothetical protein